MPSNQEYLQDSGKYLQTNCLQVFDICKEMASTSEHCFSRWTCKMKDGFVSGSWLWFWSMQYSGTLHLQMKTTPPNEDYTTKYSFFCRLVFSSAAKLFDVGPLVSFTGFCTSHYLTIYKNNTRRIIKNNITISGKLGPDPRHRHQESGSEKSSTQT